MRDEQTLRGGRRRRREEENQDEEGELGGRRRGRRLGDVCTTVSAKTGREMASKATKAFSLGTDIVEFRVDLAEEAPVKVMDEIGEFSRRSVMTVRRRDEGGGFEGTEAERLAALAELSELHPAYIDVELATLKGNPGWYSEVRRKARNTIVSWHDFTGTPSSRTLERVRVDAGAFGGITKMVTLARRRQDNLRVLKLYERGDPSTLIAFCMGEAGSASRLTSLRLGSPITYASLPDEPVAPGQLSVVTVAQLKRSWEEAA